MMNQRSPSNPRPKRQHYVPKLLLRHFCAGGSDRLWVFDKHTGKVWEQAIRKIGHEKYFNEAPLGNGWVVSYDEELEYVENKAAPVLAKLNVGTSIYSLKAVEFALLCYFVAVQHLRTPAFFSWNKQFNEEIRRLCPDGQIPETIKKQVGPLTDGVAKRCSLDCIFDFAEQIANVLVPKAWIMHKAYPTRTFYISDTPVALHNDIKDEFRSTIGFVFPGIQVYMPMSATALLGAYCPILFREVGGVEPFRTARETGEPVPCESANMDFFNSLQVVNAERFLYCRDDDFELAKRVLQNHPEARKPKRMVCNSSIDRQAGCH